MMIRAQDLTLLYLRQNSLFRIAIIHEIRNRVFLIGRVAVMEVQKPRAILPVQTTYRTFRIATKIIKPFPNALSPRGDFGLTLGLIFLVIQFLITAIVVPSFYRVLVRHSPLSSSMVLDRIGRPALQRSHSFVSSSAFPISVSVDIS